MRNHSIASENGNLNSSRIRALFLACHLVDQESGIGKKVLAQVQALEQSGFNIALCHLVANERGEYSKRLVGDEVLDVYEDSFFIKGKWQWRLNYQSLIEYIKKERIQFLYIRYTHFANSSFVRFLRSVKSEGVTIFMEIPTYPYDDEYRNAARALKISMFFERNSRQEFKKFVDRIITYSDDNFIFDVKTIAIDNGVDIDAVPLRDAYKPATVFRMLAVSSMEYWHGYDRLIMGLQEYCDKGPSRAIRLDFAGGLNTKAATEYVALTRKLGIEKYVNFHGYLNNAALDHIFEQSDVAIGVLGAHRKSLLSFKSLKNREYCARGIPFIYSGKDTTFENQPFALQIPADDSAVNVNALIDWTEKNNTMQFAMRNFAKKNVSWRKQMEAVYVEYTKLAKA